MTSNPIHPQLMLIEARRDFNRARDILADVRNITDTMRTNALWEYHAAIAALPCCVVCGEVFGESNRGRYNKSECSRCERDHAHAEER